MNNHQKYGLSTSDIDNIISILQGNDKITRAILFGSRAKGNFTKGSDIDIALQGDNLKLNDIIDALLEIDKLFLPNKVDLIIFDRIKERSLNLSIELALPCMRKASLVNSIFYR